MAGGFTLQLEDDKWFADAQKVALLTVDVATRIAAEVAAKVAADVAGQISGDVAAQVVVQLLQMGYISGAVADELKGRLESATTVIRDETGIIIGAQRHYT